MQLRDRRVLVTGASRGIGAELAREFSAAGARVALVARSADAIAKLAADLGGDSYAADLNDPEQVRGLIERVEHDGPVDVLVNNAGDGAQGRFVAMEAERVERQLRVNLLTPVELCRQALPGMLARGTGHIVNVSSMAGTNALPGMTPYSTSKAGLSHFTAMLRAELRGTPVRTTLVQLGPVATEMIDEVRSYGPTARALQRYERLRLSCDYAPDVVAKHIVDAVSRGKRHVRLPRRALLYPLLAESPRRLGEIIVTGVDHQAD
jgi:short-subunit dehydrogenase